MSWDKKKSNRAWIIAGLVQVCSETTTSIMKCVVFVMYTVHILLLNSSANHPQTLICITNTIVRLLPVQYAEGSVSAEAFEELELSQFEDMVVRSSDRVSVEY